ncbi:bacterial nucleoid DNA-binding protein [Desulfocapsa sulfexigens DSM 10523]|uniref:Bacterial nucleoid DNA-binding protein n=2 Tax=Desulfocapsa TaxID=53318 RepID=M1NBK5_DESSD|nr:bacterial nucleoid DNA-binding protein [Desulfocapsa sulfexigens DSM 10523]
MKQTQPPPCPGCNGTGQMTWFGGVSRFQFSYTDCPECHGVGFLVNTNDNCLQPQDLTDRTALSSIQADRFLKALAQVLSQTLIGGEKVQLRGFGSFSKYSSTVPGTQKIHFSSAKRLLQKLNNE